MQSRELLWLCIRTDTMLHQVWGWVLKKCRVLLDLVGLLGVAVEARKHDDPTTEHIHFSMNAALVLESLCDGRSRCVCTSQHAGQSKTGSKGIHTLTHTHKFETTETMTLNVVCVNTLRSGRMRKHFHPNCWSTFICKTQNTTSETAKSGTSEKKVNN